MMNKSAHMQIILIIIALAIKTYRTDAFVNSVGLRKSTFLKSSTTSSMEQEQESFYSAAGKATVDMNKYNIPLEKAVEEWTALLTPKTTLQAEGIYLNVKSKNELFADLLTFRVKREGGLGLILTEIAGGREDGVGITIIEEVLKGGNAENTGILPGDSIVALTVSQEGNMAQSANGGLMKTSENRISVSTECYGYDATIDTLTSLPPPSTSDEVIEIQVKRIRKQPKVTVKLQYPPEENTPDTTIELFSGENLRRAMLTRGIKLNDPLAERFDNGGTGNCGADGTCATCLVSITKGGELLSPMKIQEEQILAKKPKWRMACKVVVGYGMTEGEMTVQVNPKRW